MFKILLIILNKQETHQFFFCFINLKFIDGSIIINSNLVDTPCIIFKEEKHLELKHVCCIKETSIFS